MDLLTGKFYDIENGTLALEKIKFFVLAELLDHEEPTSDFELEYIVERTLKESIEEPLKEDLKKRHSLRSEVNLREFMNMDAYHELEEEICQKVVYHLVETNARTRTDYTEAVLSLFNGAEVEGFERLDGPEDTSSYIGYIVTRLEGESLWLQQPDDADSIHFIEGADGTKTPIDNINDESFNQPLITSLRKLSRHLFLAKSIEADIMLLEENDVLVEKAKEVAAIIRGDTDQYRKYLVLSSVLANNPAKEEMKDNEHAMCLIRIITGCSEEQSDQILSSFQDDLMDLTP